MKPPADLKKVHKKLDFAHIEAVLFSNEDYLIQNRQPSTKNNIILEQF